MSAESPRPEGQFFRDALAAAVPALIAADESAYAAVLEAARVTSGVDKGGRGRPTLIVRFVIDEVEG